MSTEMIESKNGFDVNAEQKRLTRIVESILGRAKAKGATAVEVAADSDKGFSVNVRNETIDTIEYQDDKSIGISVYYGQKKGSASTSDLTDHAIDQALQAACDIAKFTSDDPCNGLADKELLAFNYPDIDAYHPWNIDTEQAIAMAIDAEKIALNQDKRIIHSEGTSVSTTAGVHVYGNSNGFIGFLPTTRHGTCSILVAEEAGMKQRDYSYSSARDPLLLTPMDQLAKEAAQKTVNRLGAKAISTRKTPVIFSAEIARSIIGSLVAAVSGSNLYRKSSFLLDSLHQQIMPEWLTIFEKPHQKKALGSAPFDNEGVATRECALIKDGHLQHYVLGSYSARKLGMRSTGNAGGVNNLIVANNDVDFQTLLNTMDTGFLVTELIGHGVNIVTGDYSQGAVGFWIEQGKITQAVEEVTVAGNLQNMFLDIEQIANDVDVRGNIQCGSILIKEMQLAGK